MSMIGKFTTNEPMGLMYVKESSGDANISTITESNNADLFYVTFEANLQDFDVENRNHRYYDAKNIMDNIHTERIQNLLQNGGWFGEFDHPASEYNGNDLSPQRIQNVPPQYRAFKIMKPHLVGNVLRATIQSAQGAVGEGFGKEVLAGWIPQFSVRAVASMENRNGKPYVNVRRLITYDAPWYPSHKIAHAVTKPVVTVKSFNTMTESVDESNTDLCIPLKDMIRTVANEDVNTNMIMEAFDLTLEDVQGFTKDRKHLIIKDENNVVYSRINPDTVKKVNDFFDSF
jgi:hypothetical protein